MNKKPTSVRYFYLAITVLWCALIGFVAITPSIATGESQVTTPVPTLPYPVVDDSNSTTRADMMAIAERYWSYKWQAVNDHPDTWWQTGGVPHTQFMNYFSR